MAGKQHVFQAITIEIRYNDLPRPPVEGQLGDGQDWSNRLDSHGLTGHYDQDSDRYKYSLH